MTWFICRLSWWEQLRDFREAVIAQKQNRSSRGRPQTRFLRQLPNGNPGVWFKPPCGGYDGPSQGRGVAQTTLTRLMLCPTYLEVHLNLRLLFTGFSLTSSAANPAVPVMVNTDYCCTMDYVWNDDCPECENWMDHVDTVGTMWVESFCAVWILCPSHNTSLCSRWRGQGCCLMWSAASRGLTGLLSRIIFLHLSASTSSFKIS